MISTAWVSSEKCAQLQRKTDSTCYMICLAAYFFCGTDGKCGGSGAKCISGNEGCLSNSCSEEIGSVVSGVCSSPPAEGVSNGMACSLDSNCESGSCDSETFLCRQGLALAPSQAARMRTKRDGSSHYNPKERRGKVSSWFRSHAYCATGQTACTTVGGFEVSSSIFPSLMQSYEEVG